MAPSPSSSYSWATKLENSSTLVHGHPRCDKARYGQHILPSVSQASAYSLPSVLQLLLGKENEMQFYFWASLSFPKPYFTLTISSTELKWINELEEGKN